MVTQNNQGVWSFLKSRFWNRGSCHIRLFVNLTNKFEFIFIRARMPSILAIQTWIKASKLQLALSHFKIAMASTPSMNNTSSESDFTLSVIGYIVFSVILGIVILMQWYEHCYYTPKPYHSPSTVSPHKNDRQSHGHPEQSRRLLPGSSTVNISSEH
jgi:hypothetical protein